MLDQVPDLPLVSPSAESASATTALAEPVAPLVIDILVRPPASEDCAERDPDPFDPEIIVCRKLALSPRLGKPIGPEVDDFGNAIPRARIKLSDKAEAEANLINKGVGSWNANGAEMRLKIDF